MSPTDPGTGTTRSAWTSRSSCPTALAGERVDRVVGDADRVEPGRGPGAGRGGRRPSCGAARGKSRTPARRRGRRGARRPAGRRAPGPEDVPLDVRYEDDDSWSLAKPAGPRRAPGRGPRARHARARPARALSRDRRRSGTAGRPGHRPPARPRHERPDGRGPLGRRVRGPRRQALAARAVDRRYLALVWGHPDGIRGVVDAPIGRSPRRPTRMAVRDGGAGGPHRVRRRADLRRARGEPARVPPRDRAHPPDPRAPRGDRPPGRRRRRVRRSPGGRSSSTARSSTPTGWRSTHPVTGEELAVRGAAARRRCKPS